MVGPGALKPKVGDGIKSRRPLSAPVLHSFILLFFFFLFCVCCCTSIGVYIIIIIIIIIISTIKVTHIECTDMCET